QRETGIGRVAAELRHERLDAIESLHVPQPPDERDRHGFAVPVAARLEQVDLEAPVDVAERRSTAEVHHSSERAPRRLGANGIYPVRREKFARRELQVERRIAEVTTALRTANHSAAHGVRMSERGVSALQIAMRDRSANGARGDRRT